MIIGRFFININERWYWAVGEDFDTVCREIREQMDNEGEDQDMFNPEKLEVWYAEKAKVVAVYEITR